MEELLIALTEEEILEQSKNAVRTVADNLLKTKAYYNALAANAVMHYLEEKGLLRGEIVNLHSCSKMLVDFEIADIQLPNLHIDVRAVFDEKEIFIPKKHFEHKILPDIYLIMKMDEDLTNGTLLGFVEPARINKQNQNDEYYFVNQSILTPPSKLADLINSLPVKQQYMLSENADSALEKLIMLYMDHDIDDVKLEKLIDYLKNSVIAREKLVEFENFERLSYKALQEFKNLDIENNDFSKYIKTLVTTDEFAAFEDKNDDLAQLFGEETVDAKGLFVDDVAEPVVREPQETPMTDEEDLPLTKAEHDEPSEIEIEADVFDAFDEIAAPEETASEETVVGEAEETVEAVVEPVVEEVNDTTVLDEFDEFEHVDEFSIPEELLETEEEVAPEKEVKAEEPEQLVEEPDVAVEEESLNLEDLPTAIDEVEEAVVEESGLEELVVEEPVAEESAQVEEVLEETPEVEAVEEPLIEEVAEESVITQDDIVNVSDALSEPLASEDLELQVDGLETIGEDLAADENLELSEEPLEVSLETPEIAPEDIINEIEPEKEEPQELDVAQALDLDDVKLDSDTVIGLSEGIMDVDNIEEIKAVDEAAQEETLSLDALDNLDFEPDVEVSPLEEESKNILRDEVETVTDEDVENAIAQSQTEQPEEKKEAPVNSDLDILISADNAADDLNLDELLSIESDLSANSQDEHGTFQFDDTEEDEEKSDEKKTIAATSEELEMLSADLDADAGPVVKDTTPKVEDTQDEDISGLAFAVDTKPQGIGKNILIPVAALVTVLGIAGAGAWYFLSHGKSASTNIDIDNVGASDGSGFDMNDVTPSSVEEGLTTDIQLNDGTAAANKPADASIPAPAQTDVHVPPAPPTGEVKPEPLTIQKIKKDFSQPNTYLSVSKIVWDVPEYLTYNDDFSNYLQTLGSTLKLNLSSDLLLISENTVFNKVRVKIGLKDSGKKYSAEITEGCGTQSVDDLVLQSVKNTLNLLKPPVNSLETADEDLYITIYL